MRRRCCQRSQLRRRSIPGLDRRCGGTDRSTVFLDEVGFPTGVMPWRDGVLITASPEIIFAEDISGDGRADEREVLFSGFQEGNSITLIEQGNKQRVILRRTLEEIGSIGKSLMPDGLEKDMAHQDLADMISYIRTKDSK